MYGLALIGGILLVFVVVSIFWRFASRGGHAPCPTWLAWSLEFNFRGKPLGSVGPVGELALSPGMRVADVGCGPGRLTLPIAQEVGAEGEVVALDMQEGMLGRMEKRVVAAGMGNVRKIHGGAGTGLLPRDYFDRAILCTVLGEIAERECALREICGALKPGGFLLVVEMIGDPHFQFQRTVRALAVNAGLTPGEVRSGWVSYSMRLYRPSEG